MVMLRSAVLLCGRAWGAVLAGGYVGRGAMVRRGAVTSGHATSQYCNTAIVRAALVGHVDTVELLLDRGADPEAKNEVNRVCLLLARGARKPSWGMWAAALEAIRGGVMLLSRAGMGPTLAGGEAGRGAMVRRGAATSGHVSSQDGATALVEAAERGHKDAVELLVDRGVDLEVKNKVNRTWLPLTRGPCQASWAALEAAMPAMCGGVVLLSRAGVGGGAGGSGSR